MADKHSTLCALPLLQLRGRNQQDKKLWDAAVEDALAELGARDFFDAPPPIVTAEGKPRSKRDLLITQHLQLLNAAFCDFYANIANCSTVPPECGERDGTDPLSFLQLFKTRQLSLLMGTTALQTLSLSRASAFAW